MVSISYPRERKKTNIVSNEKKTLKNAKNVALKGA